MAMARTKALIQAHIEALFSGDDDVVVTILNNIEDPDPQTDRATINKTQVYVRFPPHQEKATSLAGPTKCWREIGVFMPIVLTASHRGGDAADATAERIKDSLRNEFIGDEIDIFDIFGENAGPRFGGNWWGAAFAVGYERDFIPSAP